MRLSPVEIVLGLGIALGIAGHFALDVDPAQRNFVYAPEMMDSPAYGTHEANPNFADGKTLQHPPEGAIARDHPVHRSGDLLLDLDEEDWAKLPPAQQRAWDSYGPPWAGTELAPEAAGALDRRGAEIFTRFCATCHGAGGAGDGPSVQRGVPPPKAFSAPDIRAYSDGHMYRSITRGKGNMASYASQVAREDRWKVIRYIRSLQEAP